MPLGAGGRRGGQQYEGGTRRECRVREAKRIRQPVTYKCSAVQGGGRGEAATQLYGPHMG